MLKVTLNDVKKAKETIKDVVKETPVLESKSLSEMTGRRAGNLPSFSVIPGFLNRFRMGRVRLAFML